MKFKLLGIAVVIALPSAAISAEQADKRAVESCKQTSATFVQIADCLPDAHVAFKTIDAFEEIYGSEASALKDRCIELNKKDISGAASCISNAAKKAVDLKSSLPDGTDIGDSLFDAVSSKEKFDKLQEATKAARSAFPDKSLWGGGSYYPYK